MRNEKKFIENELKNCKIAYKKSKYLPYKRELKKLIHRWEARLKKLKRR